MESSISQRSLTPGTDEALRMPALATHCLDDSSLYEIPTCLTVGRKQKVEVLLAVLAVVELNRDYIIYLYLHSQSLFFFVNPTPVSGQFTQFHLTQLHYIQPAIFTNANFVLPYFKISEPLLSIIISEGHDHASAAHGTWYESITTEQGIKLSAYVCLNILVIATANCKSDYWTQTLKSIVKLALGIMELAVKWQWH